jgi:hypothetical protein
MMPAFEEGYAGRRATKMVFELRRLSYEHRLEALELTRLEDRRTREGFYPILEDPDRLHYSWMSKYPLQKRKKEMATPISALAGSHQEAENEQARKEAHQDKSLSNAKHKPKQKP